MFKVNNRDASLVLLLFLVGDIHPFTLLLTNWLLHCIKYEFHLISWGGNFVETNSFCRVLPRVTLNLAFVWCIILGNLKIMVAKFGNTLKSSVIRQKGESHTSEGKKCLFFGTFGVLCFLETPVLRFALLPYNRWNVESGFLCLWCKFYNLVTL